MALRPRSGKSPVLRGLFQFSATHEQGGLICDAYELEIEIPESFPEETPVVREIGHRIPRDGNFHINLREESLCLGSPLALRLHLFREPSLNSFASNCIVPYLYAVSHKLSNGGPFIFGELDHGEKGELDDYLRIFGLKTHSEALRTLHMLGLKKRIANKRPCPCGCSRRLGVCKFNSVIRPFRLVAKRSWYRGRCIELTPRPKKALRPSARTRVSNFAITNSSSLSVR